MISMPEIFTSVVVSTAHLPPWLAKAMDDNDKTLLFSFERLDYGYRVYANNHHVPDEIRDIVKAANESGHRWIEFDSDAKTMLGFDTWDW